MRSYPGEAGRSILSNTLKWLLCAQSPTESSEFCAAVVRNLGVMCKNLLKDQVLDLCHNLVIFDDGPGTFRFAHLSMRDFFGETAGILMELMSYPRG